MADKEVRTKLTIQDLASAVLAKIKDGFKDAADEEKKTEKATESFGKQFAATMAAVNIVPFTQKMYAFGKSFLDAAAEGNAADTALAGLMSTVQRIPFEVAMDRASGLGDELDQISIKAGVAGDQVTAGFQTILENVGATREGVAQARVQIEQIATVSGVLGKSTEGIAREFAFMQEGMLKTKGQLFQLLQQTGIFGDKTKGAAAEWAKLTDEERSTALAKGLEQVSKQLSSATPSFNQLLTSIENMWGVAKEKLGEPLMNALIPEFQALVSEFEAGLPAIEGFAKGMAQDVGRWVRSAGKMIQEGFDWIKTHQTEISAAIEKGAKTAMAVVEFILAHKEEIAIAFGAKMAAPLVGGAISGGKAIAGASAAGIPGLGISGSTAPSIAALGAFALALGAATFAVTQYAELNEEMNAKASHEEGQRDTISRIANLGGTKQVDELIADIRATADAADAAAGPVDKLVNAVTGLNDPLGMSREGFEAWARVVREKSEVVAQSIAIFQNQMSDAAATDVIQLAELYNQAATDNNMAAMRYGAGLLVQSGITAMTLEESGLKLVGGLGRFTELFAGASEDALKALESFKSGSGRKFDAPKMGIHMSGGQVFKIQQDFRDQDPDRVAVVFQRDIARAAQNRIAASTSTPFGT